MSIAISSSSSSAAIPNARWIHADDVLRESSAKVDGVEMTLVDGGADFGEGDDGAVFAVERTTAGAPSARGMNVETEVNARPR